MPPKQDFKKVLEEEKKRLEDAKKLVEEDAAKSAAAAAASAKTTAQMQPLRVATDSSAAAAAVAFTPMPLATETGRHPREDGTEDTSASGGTEVRNPVTRVVMFASPHKFADVNQLNGFPPPQDSEDGSASRKPPAVVTALQQAVVVDDKTKEAKSEEATKAFAAWAAGIAADIDAIVDARALPGLVGIQGWEVRICQEIFSGKKPITYTINVYVLYASDNGKVLIVDLESLAQAKMGNGVPLVAAVTLVEGVLDKPTQVEVRPGALLAVSATRPSLLASGERVYIARPRPADAKYAKVASPTVPNYADSFEPLRTLWGSLPRHLVFFERGAVEFAVRAVKRTSSKFGESILVSLDSSSAADKITIKVFVNVALLPVDLQFSALRLTHFVVLRQADWQNAPSYVLKTFHGLTVIEPVFGDVAARDLFGAAE